MIRLLLNLSLIFLLFIFNFSFLQFTSVYFGYINLLLIVLIFSFALMNSEQVILCVILFSVLGEIFTFLPFLFFTTLIILSSLLIYFLFFRIFTDRSFYSFLMVTILSIFFYEVLVRALIFLWRGDSFLFAREFWIIIFNSILFNFLVVSCCFYIFNFLSNKFNSLFIKYE